MLRKGFDLLRKSKDYRTFVRRRLRFARLWAFLDLCQSVKKRFLTDCKKAAVETAAFFRVSIKAQTIKTRYGGRAFLLFGTKPEATTHQHISGPRKSLLRKGFALLRKPKDYRTFVRRRLRFACLWRLFDLCQSVKNDFFDRLKSGIPERYTGLYF